MALVVAEKEGTHGLLLVVTDSKIIGTLFEEKKKQLDLRSPFYQGKERSKEEIKQLIVTARDIVFTGKEAVALGVELDLVDPQKILYVQNVPHAQVALG
ncbi:DUF424 family protein [Candidatus Woesearchaeota archaeon]|nr:DUF424 family protein [Candidatus Woesearchaeota archaeon]